jgi:hypothetical protein
MGFLIQLTKATLLATDLFPEDKIENLMRRLFTPLPTVLSCNTILVEASAGIAEVTKSVTLFIGKNVAPPIACGLAARHLYDKLNKHERQSGWAEDTKEKSQE